MTNKLEEFEKLVERLERASEENARLSAEIDGLEVHVKDLREALERAYQHIASPAPVDIPATIETKEPQ